MEKNLKKNRYMYICINHFAVLLKVIQHCKSKIYIKKEEEEERK